MSTRCIPGFPGARFTTSAKEPSVRYRSILLFISLFSVINGFYGCYLNPKKCYLGSEQPKQNLAFIVQTEYFESRPVFILDPTGRAKIEIRIDDLGIIVLPGQYIFRAKLYGYYFRRSFRLADVPVDPGHSSFTLPKAVLEKVREKEPYMISDDTSLTVEGGGKYGVWCTHQGKIKNKVLGLYK